MYGILQRIVDTYPKAFNMLVELPKKPATR